MIYFCADDYGVSEKSNERMENCLRNGVLNKISVLPNGDIEDLKTHLRDTGATAGLHINLIEGYPLSEKSDISLLLSDDGRFKYSFIGLFKKSLSSKRKEIEEQIYKEIRAQVQFWKKTVGESAPVILDSHQHVHMIPMVFRALLRVIEDEKLNVAYMRIPAEPISPYILTPSLYLSYSPTGLIKQWLLKFLGFVNRKKVKSSGLFSAYFMGVLFSGRMDERKIKKVLPKYIKLSEKHNKDIELGFHPGYIENGEPLLDGSREGFHKFYFSPWRKTEHDTLVNFKF